MFVFGALSTDDAEDTFRQGGRENRPKPAKTNPPPSK